MKLRLEHISKTLNQQQVLRDVSMVLEPGTIVGLRGRNGSGKTMLMRVMAGLLVPDEGQVFVDEEPLGKDRSFPPKMGIFIESPSYLPSLTAMENLQALNRIGEGVPRSELQEWLRTFDLDPESHKPVRRFSLGMKHKICLIMALMGSKELILLDEPFNALDEHSRQILETKLRERKKEGAIVVIASHDREDLVQLSDVIYEMKEGVLSSGGASVHE